MIEDDIPVELSQALIASVALYPYHELIAYAHGCSVAELEDYLRRGSVAPRDTGIAWFAQEYSRADAVFAGESWRKILELSEAKGGNLRPLTEWYERRWPVVNPISIAGILASDKTEQMSLVESFENPNAPVKQALDACGYFRAGDLLNPGPELQRALAAAGLARREVAGDQPLPGATPEV